MLDNLRAATVAAQRRRRVTFVVPHRRWEPGDYDDWDHPNPTQRAVQQRHTVAAGSGAVSGTRISRHSRAMW